MIRTVGMMIGEGLVQQPAIEHEIERSVGSLHQNRRQQVVQALVALLIVACPLHALSKISDAHHKAAPMEPGHSQTRRAPRA